MAAILFSIVDLRFTTQPSPRSLPRKSQIANRKSRRRPLAPFETAPVAAPGDDGEQEMIAVG
jgi:hypothetical protein